MKEALFPDFYGGSQPYENLVSNSQYTKRLSLAFAKAGIWEEVEELDVNQRGENRLKNRTSKLMVKALEGQLSAHDIWRTTGSGITGDVIRWIDAQRKETIRTKGNRLTGGIVRRIGEKRKNNGVERPKVEYQPGQIQDEDLLLELAPDLTYQLGLIPGNQLKNLQLRLAIGDFAGAAVTYAEINTGLWYHDQKGANETTLKAAFQMSNHAYDLTEVASAAHEIHTQAFLSRLTPIENEIMRHAPDKEIPDREQVNKLLEELYWELTQGHITSPQDSLLVEARFIDLFRRIDPEGLRVDDAIMGVNQKWTAFEKQDGMIDHLAQLGEALKKEGLHFVKRWKPLREGGYVGYSLIPVEKIQGNEVSLSAKTGVFIFDKEVPYWENAAQELNSLLGEERYLISTQDEVQFDSSSGLNRRRVTIDGTWPDRLISQYGDQNSYRELRNAADALRSGQIINSMPVLSDRLEELMAPLVES